MGTSVFILQRANWPHHTEIKPCFPTSFSLVYRSKMILRMFLVMGQSRLNSQTEYLCHKSCSLGILFSLLIHTLRILTILEKQIETQRHISNGIKNLTHSTHSKTLRVYILSNHCLLSLLGTAWCIKLHSSGLV